jgi:hypothetical protein
MRNGVIIIPPHDFEHQSRWYYRVSDFKKYSFGVVTYSITSIPDFIKILKIIINSLNAKTDMKCAQVMRMRRVSCVMSSPLHLTILRIRCTSINNSRKKWDFGLASSSVTSATNFIKIRPATLELLHAYRRTLLLKGLCYIRLGSVSDAHEQRIMVNGVLVRPPHQVFFAHSKRKEQIKTSNRSAENYRNDAQANHKKSQCIISKYYLCCLRVYLLRLLFLGLFYFKGF